jgi:protein gp37
MESWKQLANALIAQLPKDHNGRNNWLVAHGDGDEAKSLRVKRVLNETHTSLEEKTALIMQIWSGDTVKITPRNYEQKPQYPQQPPFAPNNFGDN